MMKKEYITEKQNNNLKVVVSKCSLGNSIWFEVDCCSMTLGGWWKVVKSKTYSKQKTADNLANAFLTN
jgi:hypothetical protein